MAEGNVVNVANRVLRLMASSVIQEETVFLSSNAAEEEFEDLSNTIAAINAILTDAEKNQKLELTERIKIWLGRIERVVYHTDDLVDEIFTVASRRRNMSKAKKVLSFFSITSSANPLVFQHKMCYEMKKLNNELRDIWDEIPRRLRVGVGEKEKTDSYVGEENVIFGRNVDKTEIIRLMLKQPETKTEENYSIVRVIPVVGFQGIGKTTLAKFVFNDEVVQQRFELRMWVCISDLSNARLTLRELITTATGVQQDNDDLQMDQLQKELRKIIKGKRYFLVLDDLVAVNHKNWLSLKNLLGGCAKGSCVLVTTRSENVAKMTCTVRPYYLDRLTKEESWMIFERRAFMERQGMQDQEIEERARYIAEKCEGVPLFIRLMASFLYDTPLNKWWDFSVEERVGEVMREVGYQSVVNAEETRVVNEVRRQTHSYIPQEVVIGRDIEKEAITMVLLEDSLESDILVIPIVGIEGVGKTALAQLIFNDEKVQRHFDLEIWVCVTDEFNLRVILEKIIESITSNNPENLTIDQLQILLHQEIQGERYLLVLDDVWNEDPVQWKELRDFLLVGANGSRILVTTRSQTVAEITGDKEPYYLSSLDEDKSWSLFSKVVFEQGKQPTDSKVIKIGKEIVKKCGGIPFVIRTIGSMLLSKNPETEWQSFYDKELSRILENDNGVLASLWLSYDHLSPPLKDCFAYCALFPKDYEIDVETLITLWMSQGFLEPISRQDFKDLGYHYFLDLLRGSFFQETKKDEWGNITKCKMQNLMHDFARLVAGNGYATLGLKGGNFDGKPRHISFDFHLDSSWQIPVSLAELKKIRTLILPRQVRGEIEGRSGESICDRIMKFKFLRMLDLHNSGIKVLPSSIGELKHLRYLDLSQNVNVKALPNSICRLRNLQTLKLNHCSNLQTLPRDMKKLVNLRNLENESCYCLTHIPRGLGQLFKLQAFSEFVLSKGIGSVSNKTGKLDELKELNDLRGKLKIKNLRCWEGDKTEEANLHKKQHLLSLVLIWDIDAALNPANCEKSLEDLQPHPNLRELSLSAYGGVQFSSWLPSHANLVKFSISRCTRCQCLPPLDHLPSLEVLVVDELAELEYISDKVFRNESRICCPSLRELRLTNLPKLNGWWTDAPDNVEEETTFACLSKLIVEDCPNLTSMPLFPCLEELLVLKNTSWEPFQRTIAAEKRIPRTLVCEASSSSSTSTAVVPLFKLRTLCIIHMSNGEPNMWKSIPSLRSLTLDHLADINAFLEGLQQVTSLQQLHIWRCDSLKEIPSWISDIRSLKTISIKLCPNLTIPRDKISLITSLKKVEIEDCPRVPHIESMLKDQFYT